MLEEKQCKDCGLIKPKSEFYAHPKMKDGLLGKCKECQKDSTKRAREANPERYVAYDKARANLPHRVQAREEYKQTVGGKKAHARAVSVWRGNHPLRRSAHNILNKAIKEGRVIALPCFICGKKAHAHHPDYDRPLDVVWLCPAHHKQAHQIIS